MDSTRKTDLRVVKTLEVIRNTFKHMICEMDYEHITVKELSGRALINRKTFYLHYVSLDELLEELQNEIADTFIKCAISYEKLQDIKDIIRVYFESAVNMPLLHERLLCSGRYNEISDKINRKVMEHRRLTNRGAFDLSEYAENIVFEYFGSNSAILFRQWVKDGKKLPLEELIQTATKLICHGMSSVVKG